MNKTIIGNGGRWYIHSAHPLTFAFSFRQLLIMKLIAFYVLFFSLAAWADVRGQQVDLSVTNAPFKAVIQQVKEQTGYSFSINERHMKNAKPVTLTVHNIELSEALPLIFKDQVFSYQLDGKIIISVDNQKETLLAAEALQQSIRGRVTDSLGTPLQGVSIQVLESSLQTTTDRNGHYELAGVQTGKIIRFRLLSYEPFETPADRPTINVTLKYVHSRLDESLVIAYGTTTRRLNTGSVSRVTAEEISKQPASNVLGALSGRIPGLEVTQSTGTPGSSFSLQIRGRNSITQGSEPLILIDGIPFAPGNDGVNRLVSGISDGITGSSLSPFYSINPSDIESIEVLKDADATAIYGSRGANGVILITTRKGQEGRTQISTNISQGFNRAQKGMELMNTEQYLEMRQEAFRNTGGTPTVDNAPDLMAWDQNRYTDLRKELLGNTGHVTNAQLSISGGTSQTQFLLGGGYFSESNILPDNFPNRRGIMNINFNHKSLDEKLNLTFSGSYVSSSNKITVSDLTAHSFLPPNIPSFYDTEGNLQWEEYNTNYENPYAYQLQRYRANTGNLLSSLNLSYMLMPNLTAKVLAGYNELNNKEVRTSPKASYSPSQDVNSSSQFGDTQFKTWNIEPQLEYSDRLWKGNLNVLIGGTLQDRQTSGNSIHLTDFPSDALLESVQAGSSVFSRSNSYSQYRYQALTPLC